MRSLLLAATAAALVPGGAALAADLRVAPAKAPAAFVVPPANWTGFYLGAQGGYQSGIFRTREFITATGLPTSLDERHSMDGGVGGLHAGYNFQAGSVVWGVEADIEAVGLRAGYRFPSGDGADFRSRWQGSLRGRVGGAWNSLLLYVTGGLAFADLEHVYVPGGFSPERFRGTEIGWTVGAGAEWMFAPAWSARVEYRFSDFGEISNDSPFFQATYRHDPQFHTLRFGVSYKLGGGPVVANY